MESEPTIFIVTDDLASADSLATLLLMHGVRAEIIHSRADFLEMIHPSRAGCILIDFQMPGMSEEAFHKTLASHHSHLPIILVTENNNFDLAVKAMEEGAFTVIQKNLPIQEVWKKIELALSVCGDIQKEQAARTEARHRLATLNPSEIEVLNRLVAGQSNKQIAHELIIGLRTVELRRSQIMRKMNVESLAEVIQLVMLVRHPRSWLRTDASHSDLRNTASPPEMTDTDIKEQRLSSD
jgi:two-component system, LuxR family, response regulator FixJ